MTAKKKEQEVQETPIFLFTGFLEGGKTSLIQDTMVDPEFSRRGDERTLILSCEEGIEELDPSVYPRKGANVFFHSVEEEGDLSPELFAQLSQTYSPTRILIEYNGMWQLDSLYRALPDGFYVYQELFVADATTIELCNANMRTQVYDKLQSAEMVIFNRCTPETDRMALHKLVRASNRRCGIAYESTDNEVDFDTIEDPLPFDINAPVVEIKDEDYAIWYSDLAEDTEKYVDKTLSFTGIVARDASLPDTQFVIGRHVMACCEADITYRGLACVCKAPAAWKSRDWVHIRAKLVMEKNRVYGGVGPVLHVEEAESAQPPAQEVATFY